MKDTIEHEFDFIYDRVHNALEELEKTLKALDSLYFVMFPIKQTKDK